MALQMLILSILAMVGGFAASLCVCLRCTKHVAEDMQGPSRCFFSAWSLLAAVGGCLGLLWCFLAPPLFSVEISGPPAHRRNDPSKSIYVGQGCFWHTQYDLVVLEQDEQGPFAGRNDTDVTSLVGYAGGNYQSPSGAVCYHGWPHTDYGRLGHAEAVSITLDAISGPTARAQVAAVASFFFDHGFVSLDDGRRQRLDPQDMGAEYRNVIGLPGGMDNAELWPIFAAANIHKMPLIRGSGANRGDTEDEFVVYVYDSLQYPFFRGEASHQFHRNSVLKRPVPASYTGELKRVQADIGRLDDDLGCIEMPFAEMTLFIIFVFALVTGLGSSFLFRLLPPKLRFWSRSGCSGRGATTRVEVSSPVHSRRSHERVVLDLEESSD